VPQATTSHTLQAAHCDLINPSAPSPTLTGSAVVDFRTDPKICLSEARQSQAAGCSGCSTLRAPPSRLRSACRCPPSCCSTWPSSPRASAATTPSRAAGRRASASFGAHDRQQEPNPRANPLNAYGGQRATHTCAGCCSLKPLILALVRPRAGANARANSRITRTRHRSYLSYHYDLSLAADRAHALPHVAGGRTSYATSP
jgi:hypothetical protein